VRSTDNLPPSSADVTESGILNLPEPSGPHRPVMGMLTFFLHVSIITCSSSGGATQAALVILRACYQYSETNVIHFLFKLLRIKGLYMFRALLAHPQESARAVLDILLACYVSWLHQD
jgi:hypothetical protein